MSATVSPISGLSDGLAASRPLRVAFYAPLKAPDHPVPSGDREMARRLIAALERAGHQVSLISHLRSYLPDPGDIPAMMKLEVAAQAERRRIAQQWARSGPPDLWLCYHPYYKSPDLIGPDLCRRIGLPWVSVEASISERREIGIWSGTQGFVRRAVAQAAVNICLTARDREGLTEADPSARLASLPPFLPRDSLPPAALLNGNRIVTVAMMRAGDKLDSYQALATSLSALPEHLEWHLSIAGDGPARPEVEKMFAALPAGRIDWLGAITPEEVEKLLARGALYLWPGCGEAFGLAYLEAQAAGLPVVAWKTAGVPEVVCDGETGILAPAGNTKALARALADLLSDSALRQRLGAAGRRKIVEKHLMSSASSQLDQLLQGAVTETR